MKKLFTLFTFISLALSAIAEEVVINEIKYNLDANTQEAIVGDNRKFYYEEAVIPESVEYNGITYSVTGIGREAFYLNSRVKTVKIPNSVKTIGYQAFAWCRDIESITIPNSVEKIDSLAFYSCDNLESIIIPDQVTEIAHCAFAWCEALKEATLPNGIKTIDGIFAGCTSLRSITIPSSVTTITEYSFNRCQSLTSIVIPNSVTSIEEYVFRECTNLESVTIGNSVKTIEEYAFRDCTSLKNIKIPNSVTYISSWAFQGCTSLTDVFIGTSVERLDAEVFLGCNSMERILVDQKNPYLYTMGYVLFNKDRTILLYYPQARQGAYTIPEEVRRIDFRAFANCANLTSVDMSKTVSIEIKDDAFLSCTNLKTIILSPRPTIRKSAFYKCTSLETVYYPRPKSNYDPPIPDEGAFDRCDLSNCTLYVYKDNLSKFQASEFWSTFGEIKTIEGNYTGLAEIDNVMYYLYAPNKKAEVVKKDYSGDVVIPANVEFDNTTYSVTNIGKEAFDNCWNLKSISIGSSVENIDETAFALCLRLQDITVDKDNQYYYAEDNILFNKDKSELLLSGINLTGDYVVPNTVTTIKQRAFGFCASLTSVTIPNSVTCIEDCAFGACMGLKDIYCEATTVPETSTNVFEYITTSNVTLHVPYSSANAYRETAPWNGFAIEEIIDLATCVDAIGTNLKISCCDGVVRIYGLTDETRVSAYTLSGIEIANTTATEGVSILNLPLHKGSTIIVKVGTHCQKLIVR